MNNPVLDKDRVIVGSYAGGLAAAALVDGHVYKDSTGFHLLQVFFLKELRRRRAGNQDTADDQIRFFYGALDIGIGRYQGLNLRAEPVIEIFQAGQADIDDRDIGAHAHGDFAGIGSHGAAAENDHIGLRGSGNTCQKHTLASEALLQVFCAFLDTEPSCDLAHGDKQRKTPVLLLQRLIGDAFDFSSDQGLCLLRVRGKMQVGIQNQPLMKKRILRRQRFFNLHHHVGVFPDAGSFFLHDGAGRLIIGIREA